MFKLESYITPIILNYVAKYVKNIRPQDSQVSLWEGEVAFQNLDLRLDVLEEELQLPFEFLSGHIHELTIHVPWTKINSEPINITINTIEFVLKLKDQNAQPTQNTERKKRASRVEDLQQGYIPGLVNKIINNIAINCHNIILKYVEDDIVVSMNIQLLSMSSADEQWQKCFADLNPMKVILRKLVQISDLTICLDKRNEMGQIEVCQEPVLYKCSLEIRIVRRYNAATAATASTTAVHMFSKSMDINVSSFQFPMVMRLLALVLALKSGDLKSVKSMEVLNEGLEDSEGITASGESYLSWAWNLLPNILTTEPAPEEMESNEGHFLDIAGYVQNLKIILKSSEFITETIVQTTKKIRYNPIVRITLKGIFSETVMSDSKWFNTKAGISSVFVEPLGSYYEPDDCPFLSDVGDWNESYLDDSLFDNNSLENTGRHRKYVRDMATYLIENSMATLKYRGPAIAFEMVHTPEEKPTESESNESPENLLIRISFSSTTICSNSSLFLVIDVVKELIQSYNYPPYVEEKQSEQVPAKLPPPSMDEYDDLMSSDISKKKIVVQFTDIIVHMHPIINSPPGEKTKRKHKLPWFEIKISKITAKWITPLQPNKLVFTTCQLPTKPQELLDSCYDLYNVDLKNISIYVSDKEGSECILFMPSARAEFGAIIQPDLWTSEDDVKYKFDGQIDRVVCLFTRPQLVTTWYLLKTLTDYNYQTLTDLTGSICRANMHEENPKLEHTFTRFTLSAKRYLKFTCCSGVLQYVQSCLALKKKKPGYFIFRGPPDIPLKIDDSFCQWNIQVPNNFTDENLQTLFVLKVKKFTIIVDPILEHYLEYEEIIMDIGTDTSTSADLLLRVEKNRTSRTSLQTDRSRKVANPEETIHLSSEKEEKVEIKSKESPSNHKDRNPWPNLIYLKNVIVNIDIGHGSIFLPSKTGFLSTKDSKSKDENNMSYVLITLPIIKIKSSIAENIDNLMAIKFPREIKTNSEADTFPWTCDLINLNISANTSNVENVLLNPVKTNITAALTHKKAAKGLSTMAFNIHIDTAPIHAVLPEKNAIFFFERFHLLQYYISLISMWKRAPIIIPGDRVRIILPDEDDDDIKDFLAMQTEPSSTNSLHKMKKKDSNTNINMSLCGSFWLQWTVAKLKLDIITFANSPTKLTFELEDFITSIDKQVEYFKLKNKIGTLSLNHFETNILGAWKPSDAIKLLVNTEGSKTGETFLDLTITQAETMNVFNKLGAQKNAYNLHKSITEIVINIQAVDILLDTTSLSGFVPIFCALKPHRQFDNSGQDPFSVADLPLIYLQSKGITLYMPLLLNDFEHVFIFKASTIKISPNVENPLNRIIVRQDIYNKAAQLRMLHTPGSKVEDRQYELVLSDISAATGKWQEVLSFLKMNTTGAFHSKNPAVDWNNQKEKQPLTLELMEMFSNFIISITYAPCIVYNKVLISGQAVEFNCLTDLVVSLTHEQLIIIIGLISRFENIQKLSCKESVKASKLLTRQNTGIEINAIRKSERLNLENSTIKLTPYSTYKDILKMSSIRRGTKQTYITEIADFNYETGVYPDSGVAMTSSHAQRTETELYDTSEARRQNNFGKERKIPSEISFVAGIFLFKYFLQSKFSQTKNSKPLITCTINQPSTMFAQKIYDSCQQFSVYDVNVTMNAPDKAPGNSQVLFETHPGPMTLTGITPPLLCVKISRNIYNSLEYDCDLLRPAVIYTSHTILQNFCSILLNIEEAFPSYKASEEKAVPVGRGKKIFRIRNMLFDANRINVVMEKLTIKAIDEKYNINLTTSNLELRLKFFGRPEKFQLKFSIGAIAMLLSDAHVLHPFNCKGHVTITQEIWQTVPAVVGKINVNVVHFDIGPEHITDLGDVWKLFDEVLNKYNIERMKILKSKVGESASTPLNYVKLNEIPVPKVDQKKRPAKIKEEFYQDDLRAGAFQFIVCDNDNELPMAYQIQIILKNNGIICWRYPQPRRITQLRLLPIPMESKKPMEILCRMEYYNEANQSYQYFCEFNVSETTTQTIDIPKRKITAYSWRVVILQSLIIVNGQCFECTCSSDEDEDDMGPDISLDNVLHAPKNEMDFRLNPKSLVACMRVDTSFNPDYAPTVQAGIKFNLIQLSLQNQYGKFDVELPPLLRSYKPPEKIQNNHTFATFILTNVELYGAKLGRNEYMADLDMTISCKVLDYSYLNMLYLLEESNIKVQLNTCKNYIINSTVDALKINMGSSILHTLEASRKHWEHTLYRKSRKHPIFTRYLVVNRTNLNLMFGQGDTKERITLTPLEVNLYSFRSDYSDQKLVFGLFVDEKVFIHSDPINVDDEKVQYVRIAEYVLIVRTKKLSKFQMSIIIRGQVDLVSMVNEEFRIHLKISGKFETNLENSSIILPSNAKMGFCAKLMNETEMAIRLKFRGTANKGWSGDVPLRANKSLPWLVKVPKPGSDTYLSYWVRVIREDIPDVMTNNFHPQRVLVIIWPMFVLRSMLTTAVEVEEATTKTSFLMSGHGDKTNLSIPGNHETEHQLTIQKSFVSPHGEDKNTAKLTFKTIDWNKFFWFDENFWTIEKAFDELGKNNEINWPSANEEELKVERRTPQHEKTTPIYRCLPSQDFSCALMLDVSAWALFINSLGTSIIICEHCENGDSLILESNFISMLFMVKKAFILRIAYGSSWASSDPIYIYSPPKSDSCTKFQPYYLEDVGSITITLRYGKFVSKILLTSSLENGYRLFTASPLYVIANFSSHSLKAFSFCIAEGENVNKLEVESHCMEDFVDLPVIKCKKNCSTGKAMDRFMDLNIDKYPRDMATAFTFFVCLKIEKTTISLPLLISKIYNRKCFSMQNDSESLPLSACVIQHKNQYFLNIYDDPCPAIDICNETNLTFYVGQPDSLDPLKATRVIKETEDEFSGWYQILPAKSKLYYSPPDMYRSFPDAEIHFGKLTLALVSDTANISEDDIRWSKPIRTDISTEKYFNVPLHGDVKLIVCDKHRTAKICLFYSTQKREFCVKDLRSRLTNIGLNDNDLLFQQELRGNSLDSSEETTKESLSSLSCLSEQSPPIDLSIQSSSCSHLAVNETLAEFNINCNIFVKELNFNFFIDSNEKSFMKTQIVSLYIDDFIIQFNADTRNFDMIVSNLQIDNQLFSTGNYDFPVLLCPEELYNRNPAMPLPQNLPDEIEKFYKEKPLIFIRTKIYDEDNSIESIYAKIRPIRLYCEDTYMNDLYNHLIECVPQNMIPELENHKQRIRIPPGIILLPSDVVNEVIKLSDIIRLRSFRIDRVNVLISLHTSVSLYVAVDHSPLQVSSFEKKDIISLEEKIAHAAEMHYFSEILFGAGWVLGSLEILGSPSGLARSLSIGLRDFVSLPLQGLLRGPWGFVVGVTQGSASLLRNVTAGTVNSVTKLASSLARNLDRLTLDAEHLQRTEALRRSRPQGFAEGFSQGLTGFGISLLGAVGGLARHPLEARSSVQVVTGVGKGIVGALAKPISGAAELLALTGQGMLHTVGFNAMPKQRFSTVTKNATVHLADCKIAKLLPSSLSKDPVLFFQEATLLLRDQLRRAIICMTDSVFTVIDIEKDEITEFIPIDKVEATFDSNDPTLIHLHVNLSFDDSGEDINFTNQRIMNYLKSSESSTSTTLSSSCTIESTVGMRRKKLDCSFYMSEHLGQYLLNYLKVLNKKR